MTVRLVEYSPVGNGVDLQIRIRDDIHHMSRKISVTLALPEQVELHRQLEDRLNNLNIKPTPELLRNRINQLLDQLQETSQ